MSEQSYRGDIMIKKLTLIFFGLSLMFLSGCSDNNSNNQSQQTIQGVVIGSHYEGAWVCVDFNSNGTCDEETITVTDANGHWTLDDPRDSTSNVVAEIYADNLKHSNYPPPTSSTLVEKPMIFIAPLQGEVDGKLIVSSISTMVHASMQENGTSFDVAKESVANEVGVPSNVLLTNYDVEDPSPDQAILQEQSAVEIEKLEVSMTYHHNVVCFEPDDVSIKNIEGGRYTVEDFYIPSGQDPDHNINIGTILQLNIYVSQDAPGGSLDFVLGRSGSSDAATWWKNRVSSSENIYDKEPHKLNFAVKGNLTMILDNKTYIFSDFFIGQGHNWAGNNWWIGGTGCSHISSSPHIMTCNGLDESGNTVSLEFTAGDPNSNKFMVWLQ